jgi:hypothetical protein
MVETGAASDTRSDGTAGSGPPDAFRYVPDPTWPRELPEGWVLAQIGSVFVDEDDNVLCLNRRNITEEEAETGVNAPPVIVFDAAGDVVHSWGDPAILPERLHGSFVDADRNVWITGMSDGIIQKYSWEGELLLQIGVRGVFDTSDGTIDGQSLNTGRSQFFKPAGVAVDPDTGEVFVADGYGNRRVAVFDPEGRFLRQWGRQGTDGEARAGEPAVFAKVVHGVAISNDGLVYVSDRQGNRIQVFQRDGSFVRNIWVRPEGRHATEVPDHRGTAWWVDFSPDPGQRLLYVMDGRNEQVHVLDHETGALLHSFGRPGHQVGAFTHGHTLAVDSRANVYVGETNTGRRIQKFRLEEAS